ncbi:uncharacterized protein PRCAT00000721001 [Priceomyces carsonii]|uniref:uncharacterized protein n=1 Tax=Priceomyces carsonii TaxID=28549 RepID=UPI002ED82399|nr:unnamed protein product [Priceomyces carsonii]
MSSEEYDVIVIGAGVVGPAIATALARQGRKVLIVERDWSKPERIVGELMQPGGVKALRDLGLVEAVNNIDAIDVTGYYIKFHDEVITIQYPEKAEAQKTNALNPVPGCVFNSNDMINDDDTIKRSDWEADDRVRGVAFRNGEFLQNLRRIVKSEPNVTWIEGTATEIIYSKNDLNTVLGIKVKSEKQTQDYFAKLTIACDGIYSKFRKALSVDNTPSVGSYFVGLKLINCDLPAKHHGHVILGDHAPVLVYQISKTETRILCAYRSSKPPSQSNNELQNYLSNQVYPALPAEMRPSFKAALELGKFKSMPNQYLAARKQGKKLHGFILLGDALNMRHPLTGGGMTVGLNDVAILARLLNPKFIPDLNNYEVMSQRLSQFQTKRKNLDAVVNTLSIALYTLFAADKRPLKILQKGCFKYFQRGGDCVSGPIGLLSGMLPFPLILFNHFFSVAFYATYCNFLERGIVGFPIALYEAIETIIAAIFVFTPYLWKELV